MILRANLIYCMINNHSEPKSNEPSDHVFRLLVDAVSDYAIFLLDQNGIIKSWNKGAQRLKGYSSSEIIGKHFSTFYTASDVARQHPQEELRIATQVGKFEEEGWRVKKDGSVFWANVVITKLVDSDGHFLGFAKVTRDLTERKKAEEHLRESEERFRSLLNAVKDYAIISLDRTGKIISWNAGAESIMGYTSEEILGVHFSKFYTEEDLASGKPATELRIASEFGRFEEEGIRIRKDGTTYWANVIITPIINPEGKIVGFSKINRDISEKKRALEELRLSEERFRLMIEGVRDYAIFMLDPQGQVATWNQGAERLKYYRANEIIGTHFSKFYPPEDIQNGKPQMELKVALETGRFEDEGWRIRKDGSRFWANVIITSVHDTKGRHLGFSKITRDLTERRQAEENLKFLNEDLEQRVEARTSELKLAVKFRDDFLSIASHELKTPLTTLKLQAQLRKRTFGKDGIKNFTSEKFRRMFESDERQINRLTRLVDDMLDITRLGSGKLSLKKETVDLNALIEDILDRFQPQLMAAGCALTFEETDRIIGLWDPYRIEQVFINLLTNATKYGSGKPVHVTISKDSQTARFVIRDEGRGISEDDIARIFEKFERATLANEVSGLGLGLYIVSQIIEAHGGKITVESNLNIGSTFIVELPLDLA
jgi:PAS domain S-box-containing protein